MEFKENSYCYIWLADTPERGRNQALFSHYMRTLHLDEPITELNLKRILTQLSHKIGHEICYFLSSPDITNETRFYFQSQLSPKKEELIGRPMLNL